MGGGQPFYDRYSLTGHKNPRTFPNNEGSSYLGLLCNIHRPELYEGMTFESPRLSYFPVTKLVKNMATLFNSKTNILSLGW